MKIAVATKNNEVYGHFGRCDAFALYQTEDGEITSCTMLDTAHNGRAAIVAFLQECGANVVICGGAGTHARAALNEAGISLISGAKGNAETAVKEYLAGNLEDNPRQTCHRGHGCAHNNSGGQCE